MLPLLSEALGFPALQELVRTDDSGRAAKVLIRCTYQCADSGAVVRSDTPCGRDGGPAKDLAALRREAGPKKSECLNQKSPSQAVLASAQVHSHKRE